MGWGEPHTGAMRAVASGIGPCNPLELSTLPPPSKPIAFDLDHPDFAIDPEPFTLTEGHRWLRLSTAGARALIEALSIEVGVQENYGG